MGLDDLDYELQRFERTNKQKRMENKTAMPKWGKITIVAVVALIVGLWLFFSFTTQIPTGMTGIVTTWGQVQDQTLDAGFHKKGFFDAIVLMDNRTQKATIDLSAFSSDIQQVNVKCSINYEINKPTSQELYKDVGTDYYEKVMANRIQECVKSVFTQYTAEKLMSVRASLSTQVQDLLAPYMAERGIQITTVAIEDIDFTDAFTNAVEEKQVALQTKLRTETEQAQQISIEKASAERRVIAANADSEVAKVQADAAAYTKKVAATAEAQANKEIAASLTTPLIEYWKINKWNGSVPQVQAGASTSMMPIIDMAQ